MLARHDRRHPVHVTLCPLCLGTGMRYLSRARRVWPCPDCEGAPHPATGPATIQTRVDGERGKSEFWRKMAALGLSGMEITGIMAVSWFERWMASVFEGDCAAEEARRLADLAGVPDFAKAPFEDMPAFRLFVLTGLATSNADGRRIIRSGAARLDDRPVGDEMDIVPAEQLRRGVKVSVGAKRHRMVCAA